MRDGIIKKEVKMVELKFKERGQRIEWENLPAILLVGDNEIAVGIKWLRRMFQCVEIRWNYEGGPSEMGHYIQGNVLRYRKGKE